MTENREDRFLRHVATGAAFLAVAAGSLMVAGLCTLIVGSVTGFAFAPQIITLVVVFLALAIPLGRAAHIMTRRWKTDD